MPNSALAALRTRLTKVCVAITGASAAEMLDRAADAVREVPFLEFRLDYLSDPAGALPALHTFLADHSAVTAIATCRRTVSGGHFDGSAEDEFGLLLKAHENGFHIADLELETAEALPDAAEQLRATGVALIVSHHDFEKTGDLDAVYARIAPFKPDFVKIVPTAVTLSDNVTLMRFIERVSDQTEVIGISMGDVGIISRVLGLRAGSAFTFAAAHAGEETGPGQIAARTLVETYRIEDVDASTKVYGVAGDPIGASLSPLMLNTAFRRETVNAVYLALKVADVKDLVNVIQQVPLQGVSITMPHKEAILPFLEHTDPLTAKIGACNTILRAPAPAGKPGKLYGFNTDVQGIVLPLEKRLTLKGAKVLVLGAGGSARAAVFGLRDKGAEVHILNRTAEHAAKLAKQSGAKVIKREAVAKTQFDVILNTTPAGMAGEETSAILTPEELNCRLVFDIVYNPVDTPLLKMARAKGIPVITGVEMFVQQGARQFEIWTGKPAPEEEMLRVVLHALRQAAGPGADFSGVAPASSAPEAAGAQGTSPNPSGVEADAEDEAEIDRDEPSAAAVPLVGKARSAPPAKGKAKSKAAEPAKPPAAQAASPKAVKRPASKSAGKGVAGK